jgi:hypothetical protein
MTNQQPLARQQIDPPLAAIICDSIENAVIQAAMAEALYQGVGANFVIEALERAWFWAQSNITRRYEPKAKKDAA